MTMIEKITAAVIDHTVTPEPDLCSRFRTPKSSCSSCADRCPAGAITLSDSGPEIGPVCIECGICHAACPSGALSLRSLNDAEIATALKLPAIQESCRISCRRGGGVVDLRVICLGRLTEFLLLQPLHLNREVRVEIVQPACEQCPMSAAVARFEELLSRTRHLYDLVGVGREKLAVTRVGLQPLTSTDTEEGTGTRREFLHAIGHKTTKVVQSALPGEQKTAAIVPSYRKRTVSQKRVELLKSIRKLAKSPSPKPLFVPVQESIHAALSINTDCTVCGACSAVCPSGALRQKETGQAISISFQSDVCSNCGLCAEICRYDAITIHETVLINDLLEERESELFGAELFHCRICRLPFVRDGGDGICPLCVDRHRRQQQAITNLFATREA